MICEQTYLLFFICACTKLFSFVGNISYHTYLYVGLKSININRSTHFLLFRSFIFLIFTSFSFNHFVLPLFSLQLTHKQYVLKLSVIEFGSKKVVFVLVWKDIKGLSDLCTKKKLISASMQEQPQFYIPWLF